MRRDEATMKILLLADDMRPGGVQRHVVHLANGLSGLGHSVSVASNEGSFSERLDPAVEFVPVPLSPRESGKKSPIDFIKAFARLRGLVRQGKYDVIHSHQRFSDALGRFLAVTGKRPHVSTCHTLFEGGRWHSHFGMHTIAISNVIKQMLVQSYGKSPESVTVLYNEIPPLKKLSSRESRALIDSLGLSKARKILVSIGRFVADKDRNTLLDALKILREGNKLQGIVCLLVGHGEESARLREKVSVNGLAGHVMFLPPTTSVESVLNVAEFCILSSLSEGGIPYVVLEAASLGKPHIATNVGGIPEFIRHLETGLLVPPRNPGMVAESVDFLLSNPRLVQKLGMNAKKKFSQLHRSNGFVQKTLEIYNNAIRRVQR